MSSQQPSGPFGPRPPSALASCPRIAGARRRARPARPSDTLRQVGPQGKVLSAAGNGPALREIRLAGNGAFSGPGDRQRGRGNLVSRSGSSMRRSFALCEAFGLTPFRAKPPEAQPRGPLRRDWTTRPPTQPSVAGRPSAPCTALRAARRKCRYGLLREGQGWGWRTTTAVRHAPVARP